MVIIKKTAKKCVCETHAGKANVVINCQHCWLSGKQSICGSKNVFVYDFISFNTVEYNWFLSGLTVYIVCSLFIVYLIEEIYPSQIA